METETPLAFDPVCGMWLEPRQVAVTYRYLGQTYTFCCAECCEFFTRAPDTCIVLLAHEPGESMGHRCAGQRQALAERQRDAKVAPRSAPQSSLEPQGASHFAPSRVILTG
jgi:YHS domain-containing protein